MIPAFFACGMLLFAGVAARLGDRLGHLAVMRALAFVGLLTVVAFTLIDAYWLMCGAVFVAGATLATHFTGEPRAAGRGQRRARI